MWRKNRLGHAGHLSTEQKTSNGFFCGFFFFCFFEAAVIIFWSEQTFLHSVYLIRVKRSFCRPSVADPEQAFWVIMAHYRQATFHCYILSCVVSSDKQTIVLISVRRKNTWLEPTEPALSFCRWLRPSGPEKVFPFESTAAADYTGALLRHISAFLGASFRTSSVWVTAPLQCQICWEPVTTSWTHLFHLSACGVYGVCSDRQTRPPCSPDLRPNHVNQSARHWQFYNMCTMLMGTIGHVMTPPHHTHTHTLLENYSWISLSFTCGTFSQEVRGEVSFLWCRDGITITLRFPLARKDFFPLCW